MTKNSQDSMKSMFLCLMLGVCMLALSACGDSANSSENGEPGMSAETYQIKEGVPSQPLGNVAGLIEVNNRLGFSTSLNMIHGLNMTDSEPPQIIDGYQQVKPNFVRSRKLRIEQIMEPSGAKVIQVDVSLDTPLALKSLRGVTKDEFVPGPLLQDTIGNSYWASGYILETVGGGADPVVAIDRGRQFKNLNDLPRLSRNRPQRLHLIFFVNQGVTLNSFSYGGDEPKFSFTLQVDNR